MHVTKNPSLDQGYPTSRDLRRGVGGRGRGGGDFMTVGMDGSVTLSELLAEFLSGPEKAYWGRLNLFFSRGRYFLPLSAVARPVQRVPVHRPS